MMIYHIVLPEVWSEIKEQKFYEAESLQSEGFIHCSFAHQLEGVIERYYAGTGKIIVLEIDSGRLVSELVHEASTNDEIYPHIYGKLNCDSIVKTEERTAQTAEEKPQSDAKSTINH
jgi:uncharacterized protein (DUF952 family)